MNKGSGKGGKAEQSAARGERLSVALRENLKRRKAQARARERAPGDEAAPEAPKAQSSAPDFRRNPSGK